MAKKTPVGPAKGQKSIASFFARVEKPKSGPGPAGGAAAGAGGDTRAPAAAAAQPPQHQPAAAGAGTPASGGGAGTPGDAGPVAATAAAAVQVTPVRSNDTAAPDQKAAAAAARAPAPARARAATAATDNADNAATPGDIPNLVGAAIEVWWPAEAEWFRGTVTSRDAATGRYRVAYDDGDVEALTLTGGPDGGGEGGEGERWRRAEEGGGGSEGEQEEAAPPPRRRASAQDDDGDDDDDEAEAAAAARRAKAQGTAAAGAAGGAANDKAPSPPPRASGRGRRAAAAAAARKLAPAKRASTDEEDDDDDDDSGSGSSDFEAGAASSSDDDGEDMEEEDPTSDEAGGADASDDADFAAAGAGKKRRRAPAAASGGAKKNKPAAAAAAKKGSKAAAAASEEGEDGVGAAANAANAANAATTPLAAAAGATPASAFGFRAPPSTGGAGASRDPSSTMPPPAARRPSLAGGPFATPCTPATAGGGAAAAGGAADALVLGVATPATVAAAAASAAPDAARFAARMAERFPFLRPDRIRDARGRKPTEAGYDRRTLLVPQGWFRDAKVTEAQQQWWRFKAANFDGVLLFKVGKFYEMYEMDAYVGAEALGLSFMRGEQPHVGFPEAAYSAMAEGLARQGYRVVVVEQTETPEALRLRNEARKAKGLKAAGVVEREAVAVLTRGTLADAEMVDKAPDAAYVLAVAELEPPPPLPAGASAASAAAAYSAAAPAAAAVTFEPADPTGVPASAPPPPVVTLGACAVDVASARVLVGGWPDGEVRLALRSALTVLRPVELVLPAQPQSQGGAGSAAASSAVGLAPSTARLMRTALRAPPCNELLPRRAPRGGGGGAGTTAASAASPLPAGASPAPVGARTAAASLAAASADDLCSPAEAWGHEAAAAALGRYFPAGALPPLLAALAEVASGGGGEGGDDPAGVLSARAALASLALGAQFLREALLDASTLPLARYELLPEAASGPLGAALRRRAANANADGAAANASGLPWAAATPPPADAAAPRDSAADDPKARAKARRLARASDPLSAHGGPEGMRLDGAALEGLEVLENAQGGPAGTLLGLLDHCATPFGRRRLRAWLSRPLYRAGDVALRQDAVGELMGVAVPQQGGPEVEGGGGNDDDGDNDGGDAADWEGGGGAAAVSAAAADARRSLAGVADVERAVARLVASAGAIGEDDQGEGAGGATAGGGHGRDAAHVVLYEDVEKRRVKALVSALRDLQRVRGALAAVAAAKPRSLLLRALCDPARWRAADALLSELLSAADWDEAATTGRVLPKRAGAAPAVDAADARAAEAEREIRAYLKEQRAENFGNSGAVTYVSLHKDPFVIEVPDVLATPSGKGGKSGGGGAPRSYELVGQRKGFKRYLTPRLRELVADLQEARDAREQALGGVLRALTRRFARGRRAWLGAADAAAALDALVALAGAAMAAGGAAEGGVCRPRVFEPGTPAYQRAVEEARAGVRAAGGEGGGGAAGAGAGAGADDAAGTAAGNDPSSAPPIFHAVGLRHPAGLSGREGGAFVPNDILLGGGTGCAPPLAVLTGPNMGGKSTLLRQACLAAVLAQCGAWVPARALSLTPFDAVHVRMGARDHILAGQSTFFVELSETASMLASATRRSMAALDELGRGTATQDGAAVAAAVLEHLARRVGCLGLFATHYHQLGCSGSGANGGEEALLMGGRVAPMHMACALRRPAANANAGGGAGSAAPPEVTFLYKLTPGGCPKSYGTNVARLAGLPEAVVRRAALLAAAHASLAEGGAGGGGGQQQGAAAGGGAEAGEAEAAAVAAIAAKVVRAVKAGGAASAGVLAQLRREAEAALADLDEEEGAATAAAAAAGAAAVAAAG